MPLPLYLQGIAPGIHCIGSRVASRAGLDIMEKGKIFRAYWKSNPNSTVVQPIA
jgi:hypothetical protein